MNNRPDCIPCCLRRVLHTADVVSDDEWLHRKILGEVMQDLCRVDELMTPAEMIFSISRKASKTLGVTDPFAAEKKRWSDEVNGNLDVIRAKVDESPDPFRKALELSLAANLIACETRDGLVRAGHGSASGFNLVSLLAEVDALPFADENVEDFRESVAQADRILFVHDAAGELFFDRLLIETLQKPADSVASVVRESPILGCATREDAKAFGIDEVARVIDPGIACLGVPLSACSKGFREDYAAASLVIAKGQAAYETLEGDSVELDGSAKETYFLLRVRCDVMARQLGVAVGDCVLEPN